MPARTLGVILIPLILTFPSSSQSDEKVQILFDLEDSDSTISKLVEKKFSNTKFKEKISFGNFPKLGIFTDSDKLLAGQKEIESKNTVFIIGGKSYYGVQLGNSKTMANVTKSSGTQMRYLPLFDLSPLLQAKVMDAVYRHKKQDDTKAVHTILVLNPSLNNPYRPWENIDILQTLMSSIRGSTQIIFYNNNHLEIVRTIRDAHHADVLILLNSDAAWKILKEATVRKIFHPKSRWFVFLPLLSNLDIFDIGSNYSSSNINIIQLAAERSSVSSSGNQPYLSVYNDASAIILQLLERLYNYANNNVTIVGETGNFTVQNGTEPTAVRDSWKINVFHGLGDPAEIVGNVVLDSDGNIESLTLPKPESEKMSYAQLYEKLNENALEVVTVIDPPFVEYKEEYKNEKTGDMKGKLKGVIIDIAEELFKIMKIKNYNLKIDDSGVYGSEQPDKSWSGMVGQLLSGKADFAAAAFAISAERERVVDFLQSFSSFRGSLLIKEHQEEGLSAIFQFTFPFHYIVWAMLLGSIFVTAIFMTIFHCVIPSTANFNLYESIYFTLGSSFQGVTSTPPDRPCNRIVVAFWWFFCLIVIITYTATYAAYRAESRATGDISSISGLFAQRKYEYGTVKGTSYETLIKTSSSTDIQKLRLMIPRFKNGFVNTSQTALNLVRRGEYVFIYDDTINRYFAYKYCLKSTGQFEYFQYAFIIRKDSIFKPLFNSKISELKLTGRLNEILSKYYYMSDKTTKVNPECHSTGYFGVIKKYFPERLIQSLPTDGFTLTQTLGIFAIFIIGGVLSILLALIECLCRICCKNLRDRRERQKTESRA